MQIVDITNYYYNPFALPHFLSALFILGLMFFFFISEGRSFVCFSLLLLTTTFLMLTGNDAMVFCSANAETAHWWIQFTHIGVTMIAPSCMQFGFALLGIYKRHRRTIIAAWLISSLFLILSFTSGQFTVAMRKRWWGYYPVYGWIGSALILFSISILAYSFYHIVAEYRKAAPGSLQRARAQSCIIAFAIGYLGTIDFIATYNIDFYPGGFIPIAISLTLLARTARRYRLDITPGLASPNIIETMSDALVILRDDGSIALTNQVTEHLFATPKELLVGRKLSDLTNWELFTDIKKLTTACPIHALPVSLPHSKNNPVFLEISVSVRRVNTLVFAFICLFRDVTTRQIAENQLKQDHEKLEQKVAERTLALQLANDDLQRKAVERLRIEKEREELIVKSVAQSKLASLGEIATGIAHEINQPLTFIKIIFQALERDIEAGRLDIEELGTDCQESLRQINRITTIINHLRTFGRGDDATLAHNVKIDEVVANTMILMNERLRLKGIKITIDIEKNLPAISGQPVRLEQVLINLIQNAIDAVEGHKNPEIRITINRIGDTIVLLFADNGSGIPEAIANKIFEPFFTSKEVGMGTGLGLSISYGIIADHQGTIELDTSLPAWTTFRITLTAKSPDGGCHALRP